jgi:hypothetical protein
MDKSPIGDRKRAMNRTRRRMSAAFLAGDIKGAVKEAMLWHDYNVKNALASEKMFTGFQNRQADCEFAFAAATESPVPAEEPVAA